MGDGLFVCDTTSVEVRDLYGGFVQEHSDLLGRMIESCRHWQNTFATHLQFRCDELRGCRCKSFFNHAVWRDTYEPFVTEMHRWNANILAHLRDRSCLIENSETFPEFRHKYLRLATAILEWQGRHADNQENYLSESLCTPCFETSSRVHHQALEFLYFQRRPTLDIRQVSISFSLSHTHARKCTCSC